MRNITKVVLHCSATPPDMNIGADTIKRWHVDPPPKGNGWADIGYHWVIKRDGTLEKGRPEEKQGAHCAANGGNLDSIGVCMVGGVRREGAKLVTENNFTPEQWWTLKQVLEDLTRRYPKIVSIKGHRDYDKGKDCPSFNVGEWLKLEGCIDRRFWNG